MLGRIEQSVKDMRALLTENKSEHTALAKRVSSLERSRVWAKAWIAGAVAVATASAGLAAALYKIVTKGNG